MKINHNISAIIANGNLRKSENRVTSAVERLSSGLRINCSGDDPAGMAISQKMKTQIRGLSRASDNASDGISVIETAEGALTEVHSILNRMRELAVQAANDTNETSDRESIQTEIDSLLEEIDRISSDTQFNGVNLLDGTLDYKGYSDTEGIEVVTFSDTVPDQKYRIRLSQVAEQASVSGDAISDIDSASAGSISINGAITYFNEGDTAEEALYKLRELANTVDISVAVTVSGISYTTEGYGSDEMIDIRCENPNLAAALGLTDVVADGAVYGKDVELSLERGFDNTASYTSDGKRALITDRNGFEIELYVEDSVKVYEEINLDIMHIGAMNLQIGANENETVEVKIPSTSTFALDIEDLNVLSHSCASLAVSALDEAVAKISATRASLGAYQNRLEHTISSLDISEENMTEAMSRIEDADMAEEMSEYTAASVLEQAGISVLSQANDVPQMVLQLLN